MRLRNGPARTAAIVLAVLVFGVGGLFGAIVNLHGAWVVATADRTPGIVRQIDCQYVASRGGGQVCRGDFTATGQHTSRRVRVEGMSKSAAGPIDAKLVNGTWALGFHSVQSADTAYVGTAGPTIASAVALGLVLLLLFIVLALPWPLIGLAWWLRRRRGFA